MRDVIVVNYKLVKHYQWLLKEINTVDYDKTNKEGYLFKMASDIVQYA